MTKKSIQRKPALKSALNIKDRVSLRPMVLVDDQDIINTYSEEEQFSCKKYSEYKKLIQKNPSFGYKRCATLLGVPQGRTRWWHTKGEKRALPLALKTVEKLKRKNFLPFYTNHEHCIGIFRILGTLFGDGGIDRRLNTMAFISSIKEDVDLWKKDLLEIFPFLYNKMNLTEGGEYGHSYNIRTFDRNVIRFFVALGTPVGDKVATRYSLPKYIFNLSRSRKKQTTASRDRSTKTRREKAPKARGVRGRVNNTMAESITAYFRQNAKRVRCGHRHLKGSTRIGKTPGNTARI